MNYFELYDLPVTFNPDQELIKQRFYALSKKYHPDFYINESQEKQDEVLERATLNNKAFQTLKDDQKRLHYILELKGQLVEGENYSLPPAFLMEMMEVNEALMDLKFDENPAKANELKHQISQLENSLNNDLKDLTFGFEAKASDEQEVSLKAIKDVYYRTKYLWRLKENF